MERLTWMWWSASCVIRHISFLPGVKLSVVFVAIQKK
jgi:hypothetical protein